MKRSCIAVLALLVAAPAVARVQPFPPSFKAQEIATNGTTLHVRVGGTGPAVVLLHGFGDTGDKWAPLAAKLVKDHTVIVPDLRGMGFSAHPETGYEKKNQALDIAGVLDQLKVDRVALSRRRSGARIGPLDHGRESGGHDGPGHEIPRDGTAGRRRVQPMIARVLSSTEDLS